MATDPIDALFTKTEMDEAPDVELAKKEYEQDALAQLATKDIDLGDVEIEDFSKELAQRLEEFVSAMEDCEVATKAANGSSESMIQVMTCDDCGMYSLTDTMVAMQDAAGGETTLFCQSCVGLIKERSKKLWAVEVRDGELKIEQANGGSLLSGEPFGLTFDFKPTYDWRALWGISSLSPLSSGSHLSLTESDHSHAVEDSTTKVEVH